MKKPALVFLFLVLTLSLSGCVFGEKGAALQVNSMPKATVFINSKQVGSTPFVDEKLSPGEVSLKLVPETTVVSLSPWEGKIKLTTGVMAVVNREFGQTETAAAGETLTLEKAKDKENASLAVISSPDSAVVKLDGEAKGFTPLALDKVTSGDREIIVSATGFSDRTIKAKLAAGYKLTVNVKLAQKEEEASPTGTPTPTPKAGAKITTVTPKPTGPTPTLPARPYVEIKETPTGWLRVRNEASTTSTELTKVYPGERYPLLDESGGWYKIKYDDSEGWISGKYAEKYE
jgi:uncharacterized protein YgiM (DUF1202 family)